ncbi:uncharacterized protein [Diabrotica undecimpunctata]|uniref:uncharacterized protein isoform X1 n=2 Tax=Diabrotica undecimpunctata TaxID=50387 RepID=UPI003B63DF08
MRQVIQLFIFILCSSSINAFTRDTNLQNVFEDNLYADLIDCNFTMKTPKIVINPYKEKMKNFVPSKPFSSVYLKCATCLSIASEIDKTLRNVRPMSSFDKRPPDIVHSEIVTKLSSLCTEGFNRFDLRRYNDFIVISNKLACSDHVRTEMDKTWTNKLREICNLYISYMNVENISANLPTSFKDISTSLCSTGGVFRDCINIDDDTYKKVLNELNNCENCNCRGNLIRW